MISESSTQTDVVVIGAGVIGLAVAYELSKTQNVLILEKNLNFGQETSSRNSEVVHSGIYYPKDSKKTEWCVRGRELLYSFCSQFNIPFSKCGKFVVATQKDDDDYLEQLKAHADVIQVPNRRVSANELRVSEPLVRARSGIYFPETGVIDSHVLMARLEQLAISQGAILAFGQRWIKSHPTGKSWKTQIQNREGKIQEVISTYVINCAGLAGADISGQTLNTQKYEHRFCRGRYFSLNAKFQGAFGSLVYPTPLKDGLGIHVTKDLTGMVRLGPDVDWISETRYQKLSSFYDCDWELLKAPFLASVRRYIPEIKLEDLTPGTIGIRPKLFVNGLCYSDFLLENHEGFIHLLGIESPGLTAALAIAEAVKGFT